MIKLDIAVAKQHVKESATVNINDQSRQIKIKIKFNIATKIGEVFYNTSTAKYQIIFII